MSTQTNSAPNPYRYLNPLVEAPAKALRAQIRRLAKEGIKHLYTKDLANLAARMKSNLFDAESAESAKIQNDIDNVGYVIKAIVDMQLAINATERRRAIFPDNQLLYIKESADDILHMINMQYSNRYKKQFKARVLKPEQMTIWPHLTKKVA